MRVFWRILAVLMLAAAPVAAQAPSVIPSTGALVTDRADLLTPVEEASLAQRLESFNDTTSTQIVVVTLPDLGGADAGAYATELGQQWGVGQAGKDNGVVVLVSRDDRQVFIATGFGLEGAIPDAVAARIVRNIIVPNFREGNFYAGLSGAVDALMQAAAGEYTADAPPLPVERAPEGDSFPLFFVILIILYFVLSARRGGGKGGGRRYRRHGGPPVIIWGGGGGGWGGGGGGGFGGGGFGGFGGGGFGGGGAGGSW